MSDNDNVSDNNISVMTLKEDDEEQRHQSFLAQCRVLCEERNLKLTKVKNARDLASVRGSTIRPGILFRMGRVSDATQSDIKLLMDELNIRTLIDLRSPTEWKDDPTLLREEVFSNFTSLLWKERNANKPSCLKELAPGQGPVKTTTSSSSTKPKIRFWNRNKSDEDNKLPTHNEDSIIIEDMDVEALEAALQDDQAVIVSEEDAILFNNEDDECTLDCEDPEQPEVAQPLSITPHRKERYFVSLMNEFKYVKGTVSKVRKRDITKAIIKAPGAVFSKRVRSSLKKPFLDEINDGGLPMLNELLLKFGAKGIRYVLELCSDETRHPIAFYCTAGKDRTGILAVLMLSLCNVPEESIVEDYTLSANVYAEMNDHQAMVGALSQRSLNPKTFLGAPAHVMEDTLAAIKEQYGSVVGYCNYIGFTEEKQQKLREACMKRA
jgi:protein tyrosine/serine phosphatase